MEKNWVRLLKNGEPGEEVSIPSGFVGQAKVYMPDNINSALFEITGNVSSATQTITPNSFVDDNNRLYLSSVHYSGNYGSKVLKFVTDKRQIGTSPETQFNDILSPSTVEGMFEELRSNGVIRGFDVITNTTTTIRMRGGRALVGGKIIDVETKTITIDSFNGENRLLALDKTGQYRTFDRDEAGYSMAELTANDAYGDARGLVPILEFGTTSSALTGNFIDQRLMISNIDKRLDDKEAELNNRIDQLQNSVGGIQWGFTEAATDDAPAFYIANIGIVSSGGFVPLDEAGFSGTATTRRYEFADLDAYQSNIFKPPGMTHINVMVQAEYTDDIDGQSFGTSGTVYIEVGAKISTGINSSTESEAYGRVKTIQSTVFSSNSIIEQYVVSIPTSALNLNNNIMFDVVPRIRIIGSTYIDGGGGGGTNPKINFGKIRIITSSYSIAGNILGIDGTSAALGTTVGDIL